MISPGLLSSLRTLEELLMASEYKEARGYLDSIIKSVEAVQEHELQRSALISARTILRSILTSSSPEDSPESQKFDAECEGVVREIEAVLKLKGLLQ